MNILSEEAIINALHNRRKNSSMNESYPTVPFEDAPKPDEKYKVSDNPKNPAGTCVEPVQWAMDNFVATCSNCGAFFLTKEDVSGQKIDCPECHKHTVLDDAGEIVSAKIVECGSSDPNDGVVYSVAADIDDIVDDPDDELVDSDDVEDDYIDDDDILDDDYIDDEDDDDEDDDEREDNDLTEDSSLLELKIKRKAVRGGKIVKLDPKTIRLKLKKSKKGAGFKIVNGKIKKMSASERMKRSKAMKKISRSASAKNNRKRSIRKAQKTGLVASINFDKNIHINENQLMDCINEALNTVFERYLDYIPFEISDISKATYDASNDQLIIETVVKYEDGKTTDAVFEINDITEGTCQLVESSGEVFDLPVKIIVESEIVNNNIIIY